MNVLQEIGYEYAKLENPDLSYEEWQEEDDSSYHEIIDVIDRDYGADWRKESYPEQCNWAEDNGLKCLDQDGGGEGGAEYCYMVFSWKEKVYKIEYSYYSHHGYEMDGVEDTIREVKPVQKNITVWE